MEYDLTKVTKNGRKPTFFTADWHVGNQNSIKFDNRPFKDLEEMHKKLIQNYNAQVPKNGICYFLGDIATHSSELTKSIIEQLNGTKIIVVGNHDRGYNALYNIGFDVVLNNATIEIDGQLITMSHCPLPGIFREDVSDMRGAVLGDNWHGESKHQAFMVANEGQFHLHGHLHCLSDDTELLTKNGWKKYNEIVDGDIVLTKNIVTGIDSWEKIDNLYTADYKGTMINIKSRFLDKLITPEHRVIVKNKKHKEGEDLYHLFPFSDIPTLIREVPVVSNISESGLNETDDIIKLMVWIAADGSIETKSIGVCFRFVKQRKVDSLSALLTKMGILFTHHMRKSGVQTIRISMNEPIWKDTLMHYFGTEEKRLPEQLSKCNERQANVILNEYAITDGNYCKNDHVIQISSSKEVEIDLLQLLFFKNNIFCKKSPKKDLGGHHYLFINTNRKNTSFNKDVNTKKINYEGIVWCISVKNENFVIRRNGNICFTGNSPNNGKSQKIVDRQMDVGLPSSHYRPVSISEISAWISKTLYEEKKLKEKKDGI